MTETAIGRIVKWNDARGFGFVAPADGGEEIFVHISAFPSGIRRPALGDAVRYARGRDGKGRIQARDVVFVSRSRARPRNEGSLLDRRSGFALAFLLLLVLAGASSMVPTIVLLAYAGISVLAFVMYALDKKAARENRWRIAESSLHLSALAGGWPGALLAQGRLRHKTRKQRFQWVFWLTVVINCAALAWLTFSPEADEWLSELHGLLQQ